MTSSTVRASQPSATKTSATTPEYSRGETIVGWLMAGPAIVLIFLFLIVPFVMAFIMAFTNQRLISPNPTEFVGIRNFANLLTLQTLTLDPVIDEATGQPAIDADGNVVYPA